jgi:radical SAM superfamily enzyme YgiQ (UPF0313 family)
MQKILPFVSKPARYINSEWNSVHKTVTDPATVKTCFCFPDVYEVGASNLGIEILYHIVNNRADAVAERCFCPDTDMQQLLRKENAPLFSLESQSSLKSFHIIGFSLQYELCYTNVLTMLDLAGIPLLSKDRKNLFPLVIAGGPTCCNPAPVSDYFDLFVVGEGEDVINKIVDTVKKHVRFPPATKKSLLSELAKLDGVFVPGITMGTVAAQHVDINESYYPTKFIVPYIETVHKRLNIEISRGCVYKCRFCQATNLYKPWREKEPDKIMDLVKQGIKSTGYDHVSLSSFSVSSYSKIDQLLEILSKYSYDTNTFITVPSLRCDSRSMNLLKYLTGPHRSNLTFAIESGSDRLRKVIAKQLDETDIFNTLLQVKQLGWKLVKLYFMVGLPTETDEDIELTVRLIKQIRRVTGSLEINVTVSPFVPKPHTPFQWHRMDTIDEINRKQHVLLRALPKINIKLHDAKMSVLEGIFTRGDSLLNKVVYSAWSKGAGFDQWKEKFGYDNWIAAFAENGIEPMQYLRSREQTERLPWDNITYARTKEQLYAEYAESIKTG